MYLSLDDIFYCKLSESEYYQSNQEYIKANLKIFYIKSNYSPTKIARMDTLDSNRQPYMELEFK